MIFIDKINWIKKQKEVQTWISSFENCKNQLPDSEKAECLYILSKLYKESKEKKKANECLMESNQLGNKKAKLELMESQSNNFRYPELAEILHSYKDEITLEDLPKIYKSIMLCDEYDYSEIYSVFQHCIGLFMEVNGKNSKYSKFPRIKIKNMDTNTELTSNTYSGISYLNDQDRVVNLRITLIWDDNALYNESDNTLIGEELEFVINANFEQYIGA